MKIIVQETTDGLGNATVPAGYNQPNIGLGTATTAGPGPDQKLIAATAADTPNGIDSVNKGFSVGGANDPLAEQGNPIGGGTPTAPMNAPSHPPIANMNGTAPAPSGLGEGDNPFAEDENPFAQEGCKTFETIDALPAFEDIANDPSIAALPVDANGIIEPIVVPDDIIVERELGVIPDVILPLEEPIIEIGEEDVDVLIPENVFENDGKMESFPVTESFKLPENQKVVISKGDQIFLIGHVREEFTPKFAESVFTRAFKALCENKGGKGQFVMTGELKEKVAVVGRSMLVEVAKDWRLPNSNIIFEAHDLLQIVSAKPVREAKETDDAKKDDGKKKDDDKAKKEAEKEKLKKEEMLAYRRWKEAEQKRKEKDGSDDDEDEDENDEEKKKKKAKKERAKREAALLARQKTGGYI
jgi:hypothetical protein